MIYDRQIKSIYYRLPFSLVLPKRGEGVKGGGAAPYTLHFISPIVLYTPYELKNFVLIHVK